MCGKKKYLAHGLMRLVYCQPFFYTRATLFFHLGCASVKKRRPRVKKNGRAINSSFRPSVKITISYQKSRYLVTKPKKFSYQTLFGN